MIYDPDANVWVRPTVLGHNEPTTYLDDPDFGWELEPDRHRTLRELLGETFRAGPDGQRLILRGYAGLHQRHPPGQR